LHNVNYATLRRRFFLTKITVNYTKITVNFFLSITVSPDNLPPCGGRFFKRELPSITRKLPSIKTSIIEKFYMNFILIRIEKEKIFGN